MHLAARLTIALSLLLLFGVVQADGDRPQPSSARYSVHLNGLKVGELERHLRIEADGRYVLEDIAETTGVVALFKKDRAVQRSTWIYNNTKPKPIEYVYHYTGRSKDRLERLDFDWQRNIVTSLRHGETREVAIEPGMLDKLMHQVLLPADINAGKKRIEYTIIDRGEIKTYTYEVLGNEELVTARGRVQTIKVQRSDTTLWLVPEWDYLPVQLIQKKDGSTVATYIQAK